MIKTDMQLQHDVIEELRFDPAVGTAEIGVAAKNGVVTLMGQVDSYARVYAAIRAAERVAGMRALADELTVSLPMAFTRTDTDLAHNVESVDGRVTLHGNVRSWAERSEVEQAAWSAAGVSAVDDELVVLAPA